MFPMETQHVHVEKAKLQSTMSVKIQTLCVKLSDAQMAVATNLITHRLVIAMRINLCYPTVKLASRSRIFVLQEYVRKVAQTPHLAYLSHLKTKLILVLVV